jgi:hypothetical protein
MLWPALMAAITGKISFLFSSLFFFILVFLFFCSFSIFWSLLFLLSSCYPCHGGARDARPQWLTDEPASDFLIPYYRLAVFAGFFFFLFFFRFLSFLNFFFPFLISAFRKEGSLFCVFPFLLSLFPFLFLFILYYR